MSENLQILKMQVNSTHPSAILLILLLALFAPTIQLDRLKGPANKVVNGDFSIPNVTLAVGRAQFPAFAIAPWQCSLLEIGLGQYYNSHYESFRPVASLDTGKNQVLTQPLNLNAGLYVLAFQWASREDYSASSTGYVTLGSINYTIIPTDDTLHETSLLVNIPTDGAFNLVFTGTGAQDGFGLTITQISVTRANLIVNGDFEYPSFPYGTFKSIPTGIVGWTAATVYMGWGFLYNLNLQSGQVIDTSGNTSYIQKFTSLPLGSFILAFNWASSSTNAGQTAVLKWNSAVVFTVNALDTGLHYEELTVTTTTAGANSLSIQGTSQPSAGGIQFDNIELWLND